jgi:hypothetical protein
MARPKRILFWLLISFSFGVLFPSCILNFGNIQFNTKIENIYNIDNTHIVENNIVISNQVKPLSFDGVLSSMQSVSDDGSTYTFRTGLFSNNEIKEISEGDIIVGEPTELAPSGMLKKVTEIKKGLTETVIHTSEATLEDLIDEGGFEISHPLKREDFDSFLLPQYVTLISRTQALSAGFQTQSADIENVYLEVDFILYDDDGNDYTTNDQIVLTGIIELGLTLDFAVEMGLSGLKYVRSELNGFESIQIEISADVDMNKTVEKDIALFRGTLVGLVLGAPIVINIDCDLFGGMNSQISSGAKASLSQEAFLTYGLEYVNGEWDAIIDFRNEFGYEPPTYSAGANFKAYAGPKITLGLFGVRGPYFLIDGYLNLGVDLLGSPEWSLIAGVEGKLGVTVEKFGWQIVDYDGPQFDIVGPIVWATSEDSTYDLVTDVVGNGVISASPDQTNFENNSIVTLTAQPSSGWIFSSWSGDASGTNKAISVIMDTDKSITATFTQVQVDYYSLNTSTSGSGTISKSPNLSSYASGTVVTLTAYPASDWSFSGWSGGATGSSLTTTISMNSDINIMAVFTQIETYYTLNMSTNGSGTISKSPNLSSYASGTIVTLTAAPASAWSFTGWSGDASGSSLSTTVSMNANKNVTAVFEYDPPGFTLSQTTGITTTESGGTDSFTIVLNSRPSSSVTIGLSSSDSTEGTVSPSSITFTTSDWSSPRTVTVSGINDQSVDGNRSYTITTGSAISSDPNYNGLNPPNVSASNADNDSEGSNTIITTRDSVTNTASPDFNFDGDSLAVLYGTGSSSSVAYISLIYFNLGSIPSGATIQSAYLDMYCFMTTGDVDLVISRLNSSPSWSESAVTFNNMPYAMTPPAPAYFAVIDSSWNTYSITQFVKAWVEDGYYNAGLQLYTPDVEAAMFRCSEFSSTYAPRLRVNWEKIN